VSSAGGLDPADLAEQIGVLGARLGLAPKVAFVTGDDLGGRLAKLQAAGHELANLDTGQKLAEAGVEPVTAHAYLGAWGITEALGAGADVVVTGRVTDAALVVGPAAWWHGWGRHDLDALAGAVAAGHVIECGPQATGARPAGYAGFHTTTPPGSESAFGVYWPATVPASEVRHVVVLPDGTRREVPHTVASGPAPVAAPPALRPEPLADEETRRIELCWRSERLLRGRRDEWVAHGQDRAQHDRLLVESGRPPGEHGFTRAVVGVDELDEPVAAAEADALVEIPEPQRARGAPRQPVGDRPGGLLRCRNTGGTRHA
jgi:hypothetical protein